MKDDALKIKFKKFLVFLANFFRKKDKQDCIVSWAHWLIINYEVVIYESGTFTPSRYIL